MGRTVPTQDRPSSEDRSPPEGRRLQFRVDGMDCAACVHRVEERLSGLEGVRAAIGNAVSRELTVAVDPDLEVARIRSELGKIGYVAHEEERGTAVVPLEAWTTPAAYRTYVAAVLFIGGVVGLVTGATAAVLSVAGRPLGWPDLLFLGSAAVAGWNFLPAGLRAARTLSLDMNFLMTVAILGAVAIGEHLEAGAIAVLFSTAELLEDFAVDRARRSIQALMQLSPDRATVLRDGQEVAVPAAEVRPGEEVVVRSGEKVPVDGIVQEGGAAVDESPITGESLPAEKTPGERVFAGSVSQSGWLRVRADRAADRTTLASIVRIVREAELRKAPTERYIERFARIYTPAVTVAAVLVVALPTLLLGQPFDTWFVRGLTLLVIACPCAFVISTPVAVVSGITAAARQGVLIKGGRYLEAMGRVDVVAFDKTGTLTYGHPEVTDVISLGDHSADEVLATAAAVERRSEHPVARAIVRAAVRRGIDVEARPVEGFESLVGRGARARVDGRTVAVGVSGLFEGEPMLEERLRALRRDGKTAVLVGPPERPVGILAVADRPRAGARRALEHLRRAGVRRTVMLTGDARETAEAIGRELGVDEVWAELLPEEKVERIQRLEAEGGTVAMVGDGVNDGPALAVASVGIAMGAAGSDVAIQTADVALMSDDLSRLAYLRELSRTGRSVIQQNVAASLGTKLVLAAGVPFGVVSLVLAVLVGDMGASLAVTGNALRLARIRPSTAGLEGPPHGLRGPPSAPATAKA